MMKIEAFHLLLTNQKLFAASVIFHVREKYWFHSIDHPLLRLEAINCVWPELRDELDDRMSTVHDAIV
jgi:hypothetical protein